MVSTRTKPNGESFLSFFTVQGNCNINFNSIRIFDLLYKLYFYFKVTSEPLPSSVNITEKGTEMIEKISYEYGQTVKKFRISILIVLTDFDQ